MTRRSGRVNLPVLIGGLLVIVPLVALLASGFGKDPHALPSTLVGREAPAFSLTSLDGDAVSLADLRGKPVVLNFWSTWCGPCKYEHPLLQQVATANPDVAFVGVLYGDEPQKARIYLSKAGAAYPTLIDDDNRLAIDYGVTGVPETFFIDPNGRILHKENGPLSPPLLANKLAEIRR